MNGGAAHTIVTLGFKKNLSGKTNTFFCNKNKQKIKKKTLRT